MRATLLVLVLGAAIYGAPSVAMLSPVMGAVVVVCASVLVAGLASEFTARSVALGAVGAMAFTVVRASEPEIAGGVLLVGLLGARALRARGGSAKVVHAACALLCGTVSMYLADRFGAGALGTRAAAVVVCGILASLPMLVPADDEVAFTLTNLASELPEGVQPTLLRAVGLRRPIHNEPITLPSTSSRRLERAWAGLVDVVRARVVVQGGGGATLDARIASHVDTLHRFYAAAGERSARAVGLDDHALVAAQLETDVVNAEVSALTEIDGS